MPHRLHVDEFTGVLSRTNAKSLERTTHLDGHETNESAGLMNGDDLHVRRTGVTPARSENDGGVDVGIRIDGTVK